MYSTVSTSFVLISLYYSIVCTYFVPCSILSTLFGVNIMYTPLYINSANRISVLLLLIFTVNYRTWSVPLVLYTPWLPLITDEIIGATVEEIETPKENIKDLTAIKIV